MHSFSNSFNANAQMLYGIGVGGGVDWALTPNIFLRAEFEWDAFNAPLGNMLLTIATGRFGAGFKFSKDDRQGRWTTGRRRRGQKSLFSSFVFSPFV